MANVTRIGSITVAPTPPVCPFVGDEWWNTVNGQLFIYYDDGNTRQWVIANRSSGSASITTDDVPPSDPKDGDLWWDSTLGELFVWYDDGNSSQWVPASPVGSGGGGAARFPGPGGVDDTTSLQEVMNANNGGTVVVPKGVYLVTSLTVPSLGITLVGEGPGSIIKQLPNAGHMIVASGTSMLVQLVGLTIDGNQAAQASNATQVSVRLQALDAVSSSPSRFVIRNCRFINGRHSDIEMYAAETSTVQTYAEVKDCVFLFGADPGRYVYFRGTIDVTVEGNFLDYSGPHVVAGRSGIVFNDSGIDNPGDRRGTATVANNYLHNCGASATDTIGAIDFYTGFSQITITGNRVIEPWGRGINTKCDAGGVIIEGNTVVGLNLTPGGTFSSQIIVLGAVNAIMGKGNIVANNICTDSGFDAITVFGNGDNAGAEYKRTMLVANNVVINPVRYCLYGFDCETVEFKGNSTRGGTHGLYAVSTHDHMVATGNTFDQSVGHAAHIQCVVGFPNCFVTFTGNQVIKPGGRGIHVTFARDCTINDNTFEVTGSAPIQIVNTTGTRTLRNNSIRSDTAISISDVTNTGALYTDLIVQSNNSLVLNFPDNTIVGGNARGTRAVDLQQNRTAATQVASGTDAWVMGSGNTASSSNAGTLGSGNTATAISAIAIGSLNTADGVNSMAMGSRANAKGRIGFKAYANGFLGTAAGDAQMGDTVLRATTSSTASTRLTSDGAAAGLANVLNLVNNSALRLDITLIVRDSASDVASFTASGVTIRRTSPAVNTLLVGTPVFVAGDKTAGFAAIALPTIAADTTNGGLNISVVALGTNVTHWVAAVKVTEVQ